MVSPGMRVIKNKNKPNALRIGLQANSLFLFFFEILRRTVFTCSCVCSYAIFFYVCELTSYVFSSFFRLA